MKKETKKNSKDALISGVSTAAGATIGTVAGSFISEELNATETVKTSKVITDVEVVAEPEVVVIPQEDIVTEPIKPEPESNTISEPDTQPLEPENTPHQEPEPDSTQNPDIEVLNYGTITDENGNQIDVAIIDFEDNEVLVIDSNQDNIADVIFIDANHNGEIENEEIFDISEENISMQTYEDAYYDSLLADNQDFENDADISDYYA